MSTPILYAKAGGPPRNWADLRVINLDTGKDEPKTVEVNVTEGWLIRYAEDQSGVVGWEPRTERIVGRFRIELAPQTRP